MRAAGRPLVRSPGTGYGVSTMVESFSDNAPERPEEPESPDTVQQVHHQQISARVPESVGRGVFSTGAIVLVGQNEFILDFVLRMTRPHQVAARVVLPHRVMSQFIEALKDNLQKYTNRFGELPALPKSPTPANPQPNIREIYDDMKLPDEMLNGAYANAVMVGHTASEFSFDFIASFFPQSVVSSRVFLSAPQIPRLLVSLTRTFDNFRQRSTQTGQNPQTNRDSNTGPPDPPPYEPPPLDETN